MNQRVDANCAVPDKWRQRGFLTSRQAFVVLALLFAAPAFVAWVMHHSGDGGWRPAGTTNKGQLVQPARPLELNTTLRVDEQPLDEFLRGRWTLLYIGDADCDEACLGNLYKMRQVRIAQNENMKRVQTLYLRGGGEMPEALSRLLRDDYPDLGVVPMPDVQAEAIAPFFDIDGVGMQGAERVYFIDPLGNLMMYYGPDADPGGMLKDLRKLLKYSKIG
jgi:hypothetical protein